MGLLELPAELATHIFRFLADEDFFATRRSSNVLALSSSSLFGQRFFRKKGFMITSTSLDVLQHIADHRELRKHVQHVWFNPDCYTHECFDASPDDLTAFLCNPGEPLLSDAAVLRSQALMDCVNDHNTVATSSQLESRLARVFSLLPNINTIGMRRGEDHSPYGWTLLFDAIGHDPRMLGSFPTEPGYELSTPTLLFIALLRALFTAGIRLRRFYTDIVEIDDIKDTTLPISLLETVCESLWYVELNAARAWLMDLPYNFANPLSPKETCEYGHNLTRFLGSMPNLRELGLQIFAFRGNSSGSSSLSPAQHWRQDYPFVALSRLSSTVTLLNLTRIKLEHVQSTSSILLAFLGPSCPKLTSLKLRDMRLLSSETDSRPWETVFAFLRDACVNLAYILLYHLQHEEGGISFVREPAPAHLQTDEDGQEDALGTLPGPSSTRALFTTYEQISCEAKGRKNVRTALEKIVHEHWYHKPLFSYAMDEELWHTDTSDEEW